MSNLLLLDARQLADRLLGLAAFRLELQERVGVPPRLPLPCGVRHAPRLHRLFPSVDEALAVRGQSFPRLACKLGLDRLVRRHDSSLSARPGAMAWGEKRHSGRRSYVSRASVPGVRPGEPSPTRLVRVLLPGVSSDGPMGTHGYRWLLVGPPPRSSGRPRQLEAGGARRGCAAGQLVQIGGKNDPGYARRISFFRRGPPNIASSSAQIAVAIVRS